MAFIFQNELTGLIYNLMTYNEFWSVVLLSTLVTLLPDFGFNIRFFSPQSGGVHSEVPEGRAVQRGALQGEQTSALFNSSVANRAEKVLKEILKKCVNTNYK